MFVSKLNPYTGFTNCQKEKHYIKIIYRGSIHILYRDVMKKTKVLKTLYELVQSWFNNESLYVSLTSSGLDKILAGGNVLYNHTLKLQSVYLYF